MNYARHKFQRNYFCFKALKKKVSTPRCLGVLGLVGIFACTALLPSLPHEPWCVCVCMYAGLFVVGSGDKCNLI